jgi:hypothetical protein
MKQTQLRFSGFTISHCLQKKNGKQASNAIWERFQVKYKAL